MRRLWLTTLGVLVLALLACAPPAPKPPAPRLLAKPAAPLAQKPFAPWVQPAKAPPFQLTAADGTGLVLSSVTSSSTIEDPLALTELHLVFENPSNRSIEGRFTFTLPEGAALSRFAMKVSGRWQEAEVVEKQRARVSYEDFLHRRIDPALLERGAGNELAVRIFPIGPNDKRELIVTYSESLSRDVAFRVRLAGLPKVGRFIGSVHAGGELVFHDEHEKWTAEDVVVPAARWSSGDAVALRAGANLVARVRIPDDETSAAPFESLIVLVDTSASRAADLGDQIEALRAVATTLPPETPVKVACFDQSVEPVFDGKASDLGEVAFARIRGRQALGASDLAVALTWAAKKARAAVGPKHRLLLLSDGVFTLGAERITEISAATAALSESGIVRADAIAFGTARDEASLAPIVNGKLASAGVVVPFETGAAAIARKLGRGVLPPMAVSVPGAMWSSPTSVAAQPGDELIVFAKVAGERSAKISVGEHTLELKRKTGSRAFVERAVAAAQIAEVEASDKASEKQRRESIALSLQHRIVSRDTAMLVLEKDSDYDRFHVNRRANVEVLAVRDGRIATLSQARVAPGGAAPANGVDSQLVETEESKQLATRAGARHVGKVPVVRMCATSVSGRLPPESVQRTVRARFGKLRACYLKGLEKHPGLEGRVAVRFVIGRDGTVTGTRIEESSLASATVEACIAKEFAGMQFTPPEGGVISVLYPLSLYPEGETTPTPTAINLHKRKYYNPWDYTPPAPPREPSAYAGKFATVMASIADDELDSATETVSAWRREAPSDVMSLLALGEVAEARADKELAERAYGSILELWSYRADMRRLAGERLERIGTDSALALAADAYEGALRDRPDHPSSHRLYSMALLKQGKAREAFEVLDKAVVQKFIDARFAGVRDVLKADLAMAGAAWAAKEPNKTEAIRARLLDRDLSIDRAPSTRFVLVWETDTSNVDLEVVDGAGRSQLHGRPSAIKNSELSSDIRDGFGPEELVLTGKDDELAFPFEVKARYAWAGNAGGYAMGKVEVVRHDGSGKLEFEQRPFVIMQSGVTLSLGRVEKRAEAPRALAAQ